MAEVGQELSHAARALEASAEALVEDTVKTLRANPDYADLVNGLVATTITALRSAI